MLFLGKGVWREAKEGKKEQPKRKRGRPRKGEEDKTTNYGKGYKYALGKNPENLTEHQQSCLEEIRDFYPKIFRGYQLKEGLRKVFQCSKETIEKELKEWLSWAYRSKLKPFVELSIVELSRKIRRHKEAIIATIKHGLSNARIKSTNNKIKNVIQEIVLMICKKSRIYERCFHHAHKVYQDRQIIVKPVVKLSTS